MVTSGSYEPALGYFMDCWVRMLGRWLRWLKLTRAGKGGSSARTHEGESPAAAYESPASPDSFSAPTLGEYVVPETKHVLYNQWERNS